MIFSSLIRWKQGTQLRNDDSKLDLIEPVNDFNEIIS